MMTKKELEKKVNEAEKLFKELKSELEQLAQSGSEESKFERVPYGESYYTIEAACGMPIVYEKEERGRAYDNARFGVSYFHTKKRAQEVADKMKFLLKLERFHDIYCSEYKPDWDDDEISKWYVIYSIESNEYMAQPTYYAKSEVCTYFPDKDTAQKVRDRLNDDLKNKREER